MNPGKLRHRVTFVREARTEDEGGGAAISREDGPTVWAVVLPLSVRERNEAATRGQAVTHRVEVRYRTDLDPYGLIRHGARTFDISGRLDPDERRREMHFTCTERG